MTDNQLCPTCGRPFPLERETRVAKWVLRQLALNESLTWSELSRKVASRDRDILHSVVDDLRIRKVVASAGPHRLAIAGTPAAAPCPIRRPSTPGIAKDPRARIREWMMEHVLRDGALAPWELTRRVSSRDRAMLKAVRDEALADGSLVRGDDGLVRIP